MKDKVDMLIEGSHKLTKKQIHDWAKTSRKRVKEGREAEARRKAAIKKGNTKKFSPDINTIKDL